MSNFLLYEQSGAVVTLTLNSPATRNVLTGNTAPQDFVDACARINADASVRVVILTGAGPAFSAGSVSAGARMSSGPGAVVSVSTVS